MKARLIALLLLVLAVPSAEAQFAGATVDKVVSRIAETPGGVTASDQYELTITDADAFNATRFDLATDKDAGRPLVTSHRGSQTAVVNASRVEETSPEEMDRNVYLVNLSGLHPQLRDGDTITVTATYSASDASHAARLMQGTALLVVYVVPLEDRQPSSAELGSFAPTMNGDEVHATRQNVPAGFSYTIQFAAATSGGATNMNPLLVGVIGLVVGFAVAWFLLARKPRAKKFEKGGEMESAAMLEARRRTLMAALKELELAHEAKEIPDTAYAPLKEEYKAQTVRVLRTLEEKKEAPKG